MSQSQDIVTNDLEPQETIPNRMSKRCSLDKVGSVLSLNESLLPNRIVSSADRLEQLAIDPDLKYGQLRLVDDDTNEDEEDPDSIASCPPTTQQNLVASKSSSLLISKLKANTKLPSTKRSPLTESGESSPPDLLNKRKYLHFNTNPQDLPPAFRSRKTVGYNLLSGNVERPGDRCYRVGQCKISSMQPRKALRFSQQLNSSGSSANSPIFNTFADRRRAQFTNFNTANFTKSNVPPGGRRNSGASIHSMIYDQDSATAAAVQAVHETTTDSLERMDSQLHGLGDEVHRLSSDVRLSLCLLKQMCDLAAANLLQNQPQNQYSPIESQASKQQDQTGNQSQQPNDHTCNCNSKLIEQLKNISDNIETSAQLTAGSKQAAGILKNKKRSISSNSSLSLTDMINEHRLMMNKQQASQQREKLTAKLAKCSSHSTLSLPIHNSPPSSTKPDLKSKFSAVHFGAVSNPIKEMNEMMKSGDQEQKVSTAKQSSPEKNADLDQQSPTLRNVRHSWNSLSQFIDSSTSSNEQGIEQVIDLSKEECGMPKEESDSSLRPRLGAAIVEISAHSETPILDNIGNVSGALISQTTSTTMQPHSNGTAPNLSCTIDMQPTEKRS